MALSREDVLDLATRIAKANGHPDPEGWATLVADGPTEEASLTPDEPQSE